ncbi:site-specific integrase [Aneurinibacillus sp. Ricciae_BoGa-3]|uniref:tyrosine-type recombinase/integrase n=1 Tax=Aneurinibacillus sp. Ricciae_BoGa-3 TaxID=3022697 RepID=UPI002341756F|nr:site-specific integrase [Aneurinibacillus sp. Ricciae_BoGa-3]WCK54760.1 site-specific integrase [Aneurinibacillus sp. Ricciae_BoGa-3]
MAGSVHKEGSTWYYMLELGKDQQGKRKRKKKRGFKTKREALKELAEAETALNKGVYVEDDQLTLGEYLQFWLKHYAKINTAERTYEGYCSMIHAHIIPALGHFKLSKLTPFHLQSYYAEKLKDGRYDGKGGLSARTVKHHHRLISKALKDAVKWQKIIRNVAEVVDPPKPKKVEINPLSVNEIKRLLQVAYQSTQYYPIIFTAIHTGMRRGELLGLCWKDVDLSNGIIRVRQTLQMIVGTGIIFKEPKSGKGRTVTMTTALINMLQNHKIQQNKSKLAFGDIYQDYGLVFTQGNGKYIQPSELTKAFKKMVNEARVTKVRFHDLRHTHATLLLQQNIHAKVVSERLGHSTIGITLDTYSHVLPNMQKEAAQKFDFLLDEMSKKA